MIIVGGVKEFYFIFFVIEEFFVLIINLVKMEIVI